MRNIALAAAIAAIPVGASAATLTDGSQDSFSAVIQPGGTASFEYKVAEPLLIDASLALTGDLDDLQKVTFDYGEGVQSFSADDFAVDGRDPEVAYLQINDWYAKRDFSIMFFGGGDDAVSVGGTLTATAAAVPLPASAFLLAGGLAGFGLLRRRQAA
ncbi:VPLPA-CTERM sorting domain-containing protein [Mangrovicoccus algicola]|uniref:VPLPA-CTERM sorting domain-containing protein n=1 Tax=Mangrovicoccus algicola TaxID=2771008 RepID=A0A8J7CYS1_9RHOB|nr:VPLPA-CTERM sorting domain-containing protein [Mangrovicoccus algicola]MBE3636883.1 VPLPA-CTERM sorting domain-containing protein [Mangrovicoccus algicola]